MLLFISPSCAGAKLFNLVYVPDGCMSRSASKRGDEVVSGVRHTRLSSCGRFVLPQLVLINSVFVLAVVGDALRR